MCQTLNPWGYPAKDRSGRLDMVEEPHLGRLFASLARNWLRILLWAVAITGAAFVLVAPHNPVPLLHQIADRHGDAIQVSYVEEGPEAWKLKLARV